MPSYSRTIALPGNTADEIYNRISHAIGKFEEKDTGKFGKFHFSRDDGEKTVQMKSTHVTANLHCRDGEVFLEGKLSFLVSAFRSRIDAGIDQWIEKSFKT